MTYTVEVVRRGFFRVTAPDKWKAGLEALEQFEGTPASDLKTVATVIFAQKAD